MPSVLAWLTKPFLSALAVLVSLGISLATSGLPAASSPMADNHNPYHQTLFVQSTPNHAADSGSHQPASTPPSNGQVQTSPTNSTVIRPCEICAYGMQANGTVVCDNTCLVPVPRPNPEPAPLPQPQPGPACPPCSVAPGHMICPMTACRIESSEQP